jgi:predicted dehydrogenase
MTASRPAPDARPQPLRYAVVGLGRAGWSIHVEALRGRSDARIVAVADPVAARREEAVKAFGCAAFDSIGALLAAGGADVAVVATPSAAHAGDAQAAFAAGMHVVLEKPMATSLAEADAIMAAAAKAGRRLFVHHNHRFSPEFRLLRRIIDSGVLGRLFHIRMHSVTFFRRNDWQTLAKNGGGLLNNNGSHMVDLMVQLAAPAKAVAAMADLRRIVAAGDVEDHVKALIRFDDGTTCDFEMSTAENVAMPEPHWVLCGDCGTATSDGKTVTVRSFDPKEAGPLKVVDGPAPERAYGNAERLPWREQATPIGEREPGAFYDDVTAVLRRDASPTVTPESVREVMRVIALLRESAGPRKK